MRRSAAVLLVLLFVAPLLFAQERWAVVIGIDDYTDLGRLRTSRSDAKAVAEALAASGAFSENRMALLTDDASEPQNLPTLANIQKRIAQFARLAEAGDLILVYFSGHGITKDGRGYLVPVDGSRDFAVPLDGDQRNAIALDWVKDVLSKSRASHKVLILDACHAGSGAKGVSGIAPSLVALARPRWRAASRPAPRSARRQWSSTGRSQGSRLPATRRRRPAKP